jgi:hypothetical protein
MKNLRLDLATLAVESFTPSEMHILGTGALESCIPEDCGNTMTSTL